MIASSIGYNIGILNSRLSICFEICKRGILYYCKVTITRDIVCKMTAKSEKYSLSRKHWYVHLLFFYCRVLFGLVSTYLDMSRIVLFVRTVSTSRIRPRFSPFLHVIIVLVCYSIVHVTIEQTKPSVGLSIFCFWRLMGRVLFAVGATHCLFRTSVDCEDVLCRVMCDFICE